jgi:hypothetical protein
VKRFWNNPAEAPLDSREKGVPGGVLALPLEAVGAQGWNLLADAATPPVAAGCARSEPVDSERRPRALGC